MTMDETTDEEQDDLDLLWQEAKEARRVVVGFATRMASSALFVVGLMAVAKRGMPLSEFVWKLVSMMSLYAAWQTVKHYWRMKRNA